MRPKLPPEIVEMLPKEIVKYIYSYVPHLENKKKVASPQLEKDLYKIQNTTLHGLSSMYMRDLDDFILER